MPYLQPNSDFTTSGFYSWENPACCHTSRLQFHDIVGLVIFRLSRSLVLPGDFLRVIKEDCIVSLFYDVCVLSPRPLIYFSYFYGTI